MDVFATASDGDINGAGGGGQDRSENGGNPGPPECANIIGRYEVMYLYYPFGVGPSGLLRR